MADLETLVELQRGLAAALAAAHGLKGRPFGLDWPRSGEVTLDGATWRFQRHGAGYRFELPRGGERRTVVELHDGFPERWDELDAWRVRWYLGSLPLLPPVPGAGDRDLLEAVKEWLAQEVAAGRLVSIGPDRVRRASSDYACAGDAEARGFCAEIEQVMALRFAISAKEARGRIERHWRGQLLRGMDAAYHQTPEYWANTIYFGPDATWWRGTEGLRPLPAP